MDESILGRNIARHRKAAGWTQAELAHPLGYTKGVSVYFMELGRGKLVARETITRIADLIGVDVLSLVLEPAGDDRAGVVTLAPSCCGGVLGPRSRLDRIALETMGLRPFLRDDDPVFRETIERFRADVRIEDGPPVPHIPALRIEDAPGPVYRREFYAWVRRQLLDYVTENEWEVFTLFYLDGRMKKDIAVSMGFSYATMDLWCMATYHKAMEFVRSRAACDVAARIVARMAGLEIPARSLTAG